MANLYRVTSNNKGIYSAIKSCMNNKEWHDFSNSDLSNWLPNPGSNLYEEHNCITLFTDAGYEKFNKTILPLVQWVMPISVQIMADTNENLLYSDKYQKVFNKGV